MARFYATVHLGTDEERTLTWMTNGKLLSVKWKAFMELIGIEDQGLENPLGFALTAMQLPLTSNLSGPTVL